MFDVFDVLDLPVRRRFIWRWARVDERNHWWYPMQKLLTCQTYCMCFVVDIVPVNICVCIKCENIDGMTNDVNNLLLYFFNRKTWSLIQWVDIYYFGASINCNFMFFVLFTLSAFVSNPSVFFCTVETSLS